MIVIIPESMNIDPLQAKHPIVDWEIYIDQYGKSWKVIRVGGVPTVYKSCEDLVRSCDREDLDTL